MKNTGIVRKFDELGRLSIPKEIRKTLDMDGGDSAEIFVDGEFVMIKKYQPGCVFCGSFDVLNHFKEKPICIKCASELFGGSK